MNVDELLAVSRGKTALSMLGAGEKPMSELDERMAVKAAELQQAQAAMQQLNHQAQGLHVHIRRLEGAIGMLREMGAKLPPGVVEDSANPDAPEVPEDPRPDPAEPTG